jgi:hypothetical protein
MRKLFWVALIMALIGGLIFAGCAAPGPTAPTGGGPSEIKIGCVACMTGFAAGFGTGTTFGAKTAVDDINKAGGISVKEYGRIFNSSRQSGSPLE